MLRGGPELGGDRGEHEVGPDGWAFAGNAPSRVPPKVGDLSNFGKISKTNSMTFGPTGVFAKDKGKHESASLSRGSNMFSLMEKPELVAEAAAATTSRPPSRKPSVDLGSAAAPNALPRRRRLELLPRYIPGLDETRSWMLALSDGGHSDDVGSAPPSMSEEETKNRVKEDSKEFFSIRDLDQAEVYFTKLPSEHRWMLVDKLVSSAIESKETDAQLVSDFFSRAVSKNLCSPYHLEKGFIPTAKILDDIAIDVPKAFGLMAIMMNGAQLDEEQWHRLSVNAEDHVKLIMFYKPAPGSILMHPQDPTLLGMVLGTRDLDGAERFISGLPQQQRCTAVDSLVKEVLNFRADGVDTVTQLFSQLAAKDICSSDVFEEGFTPSVDALVHTMKSVPKANYLMAKMQKGAGLDGARRIRLAGRALHSHRSHGGYGLQW